MILLLPKERQMYNKVIVMPTYRRADYTKTVLEGMKSCYGIEDYKVFIHHEPGYPEVLDIINDSSELNITIIENDNVLGLNQNIYNCLSHGFSLSDYVIYLEDDVVPTKDCLKYFEWARDKYANDPDVFSVTSYNRQVVPIEDNFKIHRRQWFVPWGWATWKNRWEEIKTKWTFNTGCDSIMNHSVRGDRCQIEPKLARTQNIGATRGVNVMEPEWHKDNQYNEYWAGIVELGKGEFHE